MFLLLLPGFIAALTMFPSSQTFTVTAPPAQDTTSASFEHMANLSEASSIFAVKLFRKFSEKDHGNNLFFSPLSIYSALLMVSLGARHNTEKQMLKVLSVSKDETVHQRFEKLISDLNKPDANYSLCLVNRLFGETSYDFRASFIESIQRFYHAGLEKLNFKQASEDSRRHINDWVKEKTSGKIQDLLAPGIIDPLTKLVSVNAIYFKGNWADQFDKNNTQEQPFWINKNESKPVQMMFISTKYNVAYIPDYRTSVLEIPYTDKKMSMTILLPDQIEDNSTGLEKLEREITHEKLMDWINPKNMFLRKVDLSLPKFKLEEKYDLKPILRSMGMTDAFDEGKADFSGMSTNNDLVISEIVHQSFVEVDEEGTEAAAATGVITVVKTAALAIKFKSDHPFIFVIKDRSTNRILFMGKYASP
ncbi:leukocyte elastase inhibitor-like [Erythrolamprus reginae]|uniref:leukocyte elastase inhibitor-like n=1 Tax=Erythrolamprus reginae TaxID=121349 RepID=UPI00396CFD3F